MFGNPCRFNKALLDTADSGELHVTHEELEEHLKRTYSDAK